MLILYKNDRNVRFVLFAKTSTVGGSVPLDDLTSRGMNFTSRKLDK